MKTTKKIFLTLFLSIAIIVPNIAIASSTQQIETSQQPQKESWIKKVEHWYEQNMNYGSITALMVVESSFIPFPSEVVIPPAAYIASKPDSKLNILLVVLFGTIGALIGAYINYFLAMFLGRPVVHKIADSKFGRMLLLSGEKINHAENYFNKHGKSSTFIGRLIPGVRQLISIPAGLAKMHFGTFTIYTILGAGLWNVTLALVGYIAHGQADIIDKYSHELGYIIMAIILVAIIFLTVRYFIRKKKQ